MGRHVHTKDADANDEPYDRKHGDDYDSAKNSDYELYGTTCPR